ncbi:PHD finger protein 7-like isoform X2 [Numida meleagris]|uniref:PHD finger protein 7-like isoform X2 n=1 Tax=Numida meleagris TaxID=8996 RepID=UPI000B3D86E4|nr:PHD finger protein 7-like isoform X2 [Numida meleagris]XP_021240868.1 PHD finger protein 7-like isoform X2 [Numida meleagris]
MHTMSNRKRKAPDSGESACVLCGRADVDPNICGRTFSDSGVCVHEFCLTFATIRFEEGTPRGESVRLPLAAIRRRVKHANQKQCFVCGERGATISCAESGCEQCFHLPCAADGECVTQFYGPRRSFCREHRPQQAVEAAPAQNTNCLICLEPVGDTLSYHTMVCPVCKHAWFHRCCIQGQAMSAGAACFQCPICRDKKQFCYEMTILGIQTTSRPPSWEDNDAYASLRERHERCDVSKCLNPGGREQAEEEGPWQLLLCSSCAAQGTHRRCSSLADTTDSWECDSCAGVGTASSANMELAGSSSASQEGLRPSHSSSVPENTSSGPTSQAASGPLHHPQLPELSGRPSEPETELCHHLREDRDSSEPRRGRRRSRRTAAASAESSSQTSTRQRALRSSRDSPVAAHRMWGSGRTRSRSPLQDRASSSQSRPRRQRGSRQMPSRESQLPEGRRQPSRQGRRRP